MCMIGRSGISAIGIRRGEMTFITIRASISWHMMKCTTQTSSIEKRRPTRADFLCSPPSQLIRSIKKGRRIMNLGGYRNRVARVDLTQGKITYEPLNQDDLRKYVGGRGLGAKYVFDNGPAVEPLSPKNIL